jgi:2-polyprenyl-3-methyl-5-hydroxy-6-metoxy-1,4-benzoquinol methylase
VSDNLAEFADAALYDAENRWDAADDFYLAEAKASGGPALDLACGSGRLAVALAEAGLETWGLDLAPAMLHYAAARPGGARVTWRAADMRGFALPRRFRIAVMTGHAWQMLLSEDDMAACLATVARHLEPGGRFAFETRNAAANEPGVTQPLSFWRSFPAPDGETVETWTASRWEGALEHHSVERRWPDGRVVPSAITLRYTTAEELAALLNAAGFAVESRYGAFPPAPYDPATSPEIVTVAKRI